MIPSLPPNWDQMGDVTYEGMGEEVVSGVFCHKWSWPSTGNCTIQGKAQDSGCHQYYERVADGAPILFSFPAASGHQDFYFLPHTMKVAPLTPSLVAIPHGCDSLACPTGSTVPSTASIMPLTGSARAATVSTPTGPRIVAANTKLYGAPASESCYPGQWAGGDIYRANMSVSEAVVWCRNSTKCAGFSTQAPGACSSASSGALFDMHFKDAWGADRLNKDNQWTAWVPPHPAPATYVCAGSRCVPGVARVSYYDSRCLGLCNMSGVT